MLVLCARSEELPVGAEAHAPDIQVARLARLLIHQHATRPHPKIIDKLLKNNNERARLTHHVFCPVFVSYICAVRLHPVARYFPSAEKRTQHTTLSCMSACMSPTSSLFFPAPAPSFPPCPAAPLATGDAAGFAFAFALKIANQSLPSRFSSGGTLMGSVGSTTASLWTVPGAGPGPAPAPALGPAGGGGSAEGGGGGAEAAGGPGAEGTEVEGAMEGEVVEGEEGSPKPVCGSRGASEGANKEGECQN